MLSRYPTSTLFPYTTLFRSPRFGTPSASVEGSNPHRTCIIVRAQLWQEPRKAPVPQDRRLPKVRPLAEVVGGHVRSEEHTSELQSRQYLVCRLLLEKKKEDD